MLLGLLLGLLRVGTLEEEAIKKYRWLNTLTQLALSHQNLEKTGQIAGLCSKRIEVRPLMQFHLMTRVGYTRNTLVIGLTV